MSLINRMLQDLESRNANERHEDSGVFHGLVSRSPESNNPRRILLWLGLVITILVSITAFLAWEKFSTKQEVMSNADDMTSQVTTPFSEKVRSQPSGMKADNIVSTTEEKAPLVAPRVKSLAGKSSSTKTKKETLAIKSGVTEQIEKKSRPWTKQQQAVIAYKKAYTLLKEGKGFESEPYLWEALRHNPRHGEAREALVAQLLATGRLIEAEEVLETGLQIHIRHSNLTMLFARLRVEQGDLTSAVKMLEQGSNNSQTLLDDRGDYFALLAALYQQQGRSAESVNSYRYALTLQPQQSAWWAGLGIALETQSLISEAEEAYQKALKGNLAIDLRSYIVTRLEVIKN